MMDFALQIAQMMSRIKKLMILILNMQNEVIRMVYNFNSISSYIKFA